MNTRTLGDSGINISGMGLACWAIGDPFYHLDGDMIGYGYEKEEESIKAIQKALDLGIILFDTSDV